MTSKPNSSNVYKWLMFAASAVVFCLASSVAPTPAAGQGCIPEFPFKDGWQGADAAYSIPLPDGRVVWIYGDTLFGKDRSVEGIDPRMVRNSIGISTCEAGQWNVEYVIRKGADGKLRDFFESPDKKHWYWALDGFYHEKSLYVTLLCVRDKPSTGSPAFAFETCGADLARLSGLDASPQQWKVENFPLVPDGVKAYPSATAVVEGDYAYIFAAYEKLPRPLLLVRIPLKGLGDPKKNLEYLAKNDAWKPGFDPEDSKHVMIPGSSEMSIRYHADLGRWLAVMKGPKFPNGEVVVRSAPKLTGPWGEAKIIYDIPDMKPGAPAYDSETFCYAVKEHPEYAPAGKLLFTYVCNTLTPKKLVTNTTIYFPKAVVVPLPAGN